MASGVAVVGLPSAASAAAPVIVYQCPGFGGITFSICAISPAGGQPRTLAQSGTLAGVTSDGTTYGYEGTSGGLWEAPVAGGAPTEVNTNPPAPPTSGSQGLYVEGPVMSSDGQHFLAAAVYVLPPPIVGTVAVWQWDVAAGPNSPFTTVIGVGPPNPIWTLGWLGATPLTAASPFSAPTWVCIGGQHGSCGQGATSPQIQSSTSFLDDPSGAPDGTQIVATVAPNDFSGAGSLALFSATTGALLRTIAAPPAGTGYARARFSPDGTQVVFESDPLDANGSPTGQASIDVVNTDGTGLRTLTQGESPSWGGTASAGGGGNGGGGNGGGGTLRPGAKITLALPAARIASLRRTGTLKIDCRLAGAGRCSVSATVTAAVARRLGLKPPRDAKTVQLAFGSAVLRHAGRVTITLRLPGRVRRALNHAHKRIPLTITGVSSARGKKSVTVTRSLVLRP